MKIKQEDGTELDVFTPDEVKQQIEQKELELTAKLNEKESALTALATEKAELEAKLGNGNGGDNQNFKTLKEALDKKDKAFNDLRDEIARDKAQSKQEFFDTKIKQLSKNDAEFEKKIKLHLSSTLAGMKEDTQAEREAKLAAAFKLSSDNSSEAPGMFDFGIGGGNNRGVDFPSGGAETIEFTAREKALGAKLGITAEDYKKYAPRLNKQ